MEFREVGIGMRITTSPGLPLLDWYRMLIAEEAVDPPLMDGTSPIWPFLLVVNLVFALPLSGISTIAN
ncbi:hypothetical protein DUI87_21730 [Hirundo rustica rustica]|uniref:Uncharacterized protein n=1 Tax=Hirundo rustica rustica TaxID=333673 RepID=A0A3M0JLW8_HIRRU|nr:hypothetical protein DUI87_21730 [Hirundo rustica rustica]